MINILNTKDTSNLIELEKLSLMSDLDIQKSFNKQILLFIKKFMSNVDFSDALNPNCLNSFYLSEATCILDETSKNIDIINNLLAHLAQFESSSQDLEKFVENYNQEFKTSMDSVYERTEKIQNFIHQITINDISELLNSNVPEETPTVTTEFLEIAQIPENTLIISATRGKVFLPYKLKDIENLLEENENYHSIEEIVNKLYTKPIRYYKFSSISRFKEAYKLVKEKENGSTLKALLLAFELIGNYSLHPAIITACKSLDELDIYLACLEENALNDFKFFNIKYEVPLSISKIAKNIKGMSY